MKLSEKATEVTELKNSHISLKHPDNGKLHKCLWYKASLQRHKTYVIFVPFNIKSKKVDIATKVWTFFT